MIGLHFLYVLCSWRCLIIYFLLLFGNRFLINGFHLMVPCEALSETSSKTTMLVCSLNISFIYNKISTFYNEIINEYL